MSLQLLIYLLLNYLSLWVMGFEVCEPFIHQYGSSDTHPYIASSMGIGLFFSWDDLKADVWSDFN